MKFLFLCLVVICSAANADTAGTTNVMGPPSAYNSTAAPPGEIPLADDVNFLNKANTAPTAIPDSTGLIIAPESNLNRQSQEERPYDINQILEPEREGSEKN